MPRILYSILWLFMAAVSLMGAEPSFRMHVVDAKSEFGAGAVFDVNKDGNGDIVTGGWWYQGPDWKKHKVRDVQFIRGRFDDYSTLPIDVNGDGWTDFVSANYRSRNLYWVEHPGPKLGSWTQHTIASPGPMETGRLADVNGDGRPDILPNGTTFAAWWELGKGPAGFRWIRHDLPKEAAGHGIGVGDINGDGRADIVCPRGWLEAPKDRRKGRWVFHADFKLHSDAGLPIFVHDVDGDGDNDLIWGRGHRYGLFWLERTSKNGWQQHEIDLRWAQAHSVLLADIDNDNQKELIGGKRYFGHDGKDPGERDPLCIYWYKYDRVKKTWRRGVVSEGGKAAFGLDPKAADIDGDGDLDILAPDRTGLFWFENQLKKPR